MPFMNNSYLVKITHGEIYLGPRLENVMLALNLLILIIVPAIFLELLLYLLICTQFETIFMNGAIQDSLCLEMNQTMGTVECVFVKSVAGNHV